MDLKFPDASLLFMPASCSIANHTEIDFHNNPNRSTPTATKGTKASFTITETLFNLAKTAPIMPTSFGVSHNHNTGKELRLKFPAQARFFSNLRSTSVQKSDSDLSDFWTLWLFVVGGPGLCEPTGSSFHEAQGLSSRDLDVPHIRNGRVDVEGPFFIVPVPPSAIGTGAPYARCRVRRGEGCR